MLANKRESENEKAFQTLPRQKSDILTRQGRIC